jgi:two-component system, NarL family, nitrate/nitrite response regulator NarL
LAIGLACAGLRDYGRRCRHFSTKCSRLGETGYLSRSGITGMASSTNRISILIADHHPIFRDGLRKLLETETGFKVVGEACDGEEAVWLAKRLKPDVVLLNLAMPWHAGQEALKGLSQLPSVRTIVLTAASEKERLVDALQLGARGVVLKESATQALFKSIRGVMAGEYWVGRDSVASIVQALRDPLPLPSRDATRRDFGLTPRELELVAAIVASYTNKDIAAKFALSEQTVKHHLTNIFDKLGVSNRLELALFATNHGLVRHD